MLDNNQKLNKPKIAPGVLYLLSFFSGFGGLCSLAYALTGDGSIAVFQSIIGVIFIIVTIILIIYASKIKTKNLEEEALIQNKEKENEKATELYKKCKEKGVLTIDSKEDTDDLMLIARMNDITDSEEAKKLFFKGKTLFEQQKAAETEIKLEKSREREALKHKEEKEKAEVSPKEKYLWGIKIIHTACVATGALAKAGIAGATDAMRYQAPKSDSAILGGIANGLAGPGAGIATAINTEIENARAEAEATEVRANAGEAYKHHQDILRDTRRKKYSVDERISFVEGLVCDEQNIDQKFRMLTLSEPTCKINIPQDSSPVPKSLEVNFKIESVQSVIMFKEKAILDGSLKVIVKNSSGNIIAEGYYCAPGFDQSRLISAGTSKMEFKIIPLYKVGFECMINQNINVDCYIFDSYYEQLSADDELEIEIKPVKMWAIEGKLIG